jgi:hypothetical protein
VAAVAGRSTESLDCSPSIVTPITFLVITIVAGGAALIALARLSRRKQDELRRNGVVEWFPALLKGQLSAREGLKVYFFAPQPKPIEIVGRILAVLVVVFVVIAIVGLTAAIIMARINV